MKARILLCMFSVGILMLPASSARADFITTQAGSTTKENQIHDSSLEFATNLDASGNLQVGSVISGVVLYTQIGQTGNLHNIAGLGGFKGEVTAVFSLQIASITPDAVNGNNLKFVPNATFEATFGTGAMAAVFENGSSAPLTAQLAAGGGTIPTYIADATAGVLNIVIGFTGAGGVAAGAERWDGTASTLVVPPVNGLDGSYIANLDLIAPPGGYAPGTAGADLPFASKEANSLSGGFTQFRTRGTQSFNDNFPGSSPFPVTDDSSLFYFVNATAVPEPASLMLLGIGSVALAGLGIRRKGAKN